LPRPGSPSPGLRGSTTRMFITLSRVPNRRYLVKRKA
jgi:hypothetical protein